MASNAGIDPEAFREFEREGWRKVSQEYQDYYSRVTRQTVEPLLDAIGASTGHRILDVASGPGYAAAAATARGAQGVGIDFSEPQIDLARQQYPDTEFHVGDAENLPFPDESFDGVVMNFGVLHFPRPEVALFEACRVLKPGGRIAFTVWAASDISTGFKIVERALRAHANLELDLPEGPHIYRFSDPEECRLKLLEAGFNDPETTLVNTVWRLPSPGALYDAVGSAGVRMTSIFNLQTPEALAKIEEQMREGCADYETDDGIELPMGAMLSSGTKA